MKCAEILDSLSIAWLRPKHLRYGEKKYFADFYLPVFDIYLDTKNDFKAKQDESKIRSVIEENGVKIFVLLLKDITLENIASVAQW